MKMLLTTFLAALLCLTACDIQPRNSLKDCKQQCKDHKNPKACEVFCECIHTNGEALNKCLDEYEKEPADPTQGP